MRACGWGTVCVCFNQEPFPAGRHVWMLTEKWGAEELTGVHFSGHIIDWPWEGNLYVVIELDGALIDKYGDRRFEERYKLTLLPNEVELVRGTS